MADKAAPWEFVEAAVTAILSWIILAAIAIIISGKLISKRVPIGIFDEANGYIQDLLANPYDAKGKPNKIWQDDNVKIIGSIHEIKESEQQYERFDEAADNEAAGR